VREPQHKRVRRRRRPTLRAALKAAQAAGEKVRTATVEDGKVTLTFGESAVDGTNENEWDEALNRGKH
jgi:hypothetical protein